MRNEFVDGQSVTVQTELVKRAEKDLHHFTCGICVHSMLGITDTYSLSSTLKLVTLYTNKIPHKI